MSTKEQRQRYRAEHRCIVCSRQDERTLAGYATCNACNEKKKLYNKTRQYSEEWKQKHRESAKANYYFYKRMHACTECGKQDSRTRAGRKLCNTCRKRQRAYPEDRKKVAARNTKRREKNRAAGICTICGKHPADRGFKTCFECRYKKRIYDRENAAKERPWRQGNGLSRSEWIELGLCSRCGNVLDGQLKKDGTPAKVCSRCYGRMKRHGQGTV